MEINLCVGGRIERQKKLEEGPLPKDAGEAPYQQRSKNSR